VMKFSMRDDGSDWLLGRGAPHDLAADAGTRSAGFVESIDKHAAQSSVAMFGLIWCTY